MIEAKIVNGVIVIVIDVKSIPFVIEHLYQDDAPEILDLEKLSEEFASNIGTMEDMGEDLLLNKFLDEVLERTVESSEHVRFGG